MFYLIHFAIFIFALSASSVWAANENPLVLPMGEREAMLGNTGIALRGQAANAIFNPAGVAALSQTRLSVSGSTFALLKADMETPGSSSDLTFTSFISVPNMIAGSKQIYKWNIVYGIFSPIELEINASMKTTINGIAGTAKSNLFSKTEEQYIGFATARNTGNDWSVGFSFFGHRMHEFSQTNLFLFPAGATPHIAASTQIDSEVFSLLGVLGAQKVFSPDFVLGFRVSLPNLVLIDRARVYDLLILENTGTIATKDVNKTYSAGYEMPFDTGMGLSYRFSAKHEWLWDVSVSWPAEFNTVPRSEQNRKIELGTTLRSSMGYIYHMSSKYEWLSGLTYNPSTLRASRDMNGNEDTANHFAGVTTGVLFKDDKVQTGVGGFYYFSRTDKKVFGSKPENASAFRVFGFSLSSSIQF